MKKILLTGAFNYKQFQIEEIKKLGYEIIFLKEEKEVVAFDVSHIDAVVCNSLFMYKNIREFANLKYIQITSSGYDRVPMDYINENGIIIHNARGVYSVLMEEINN